MMKVNGSTQFFICKIHVIDRQEGSNHLVSTYHNFENKHEMFIKWHELLKEDHYSIELIAQDIFTASALKKV